MVEFYAALIWEMAVVAFPGRFHLPASAPTGVFLRSVPVGEFAIRAATAATGNASASGCKNKVFQ